MNPFKEKPAKIQSLFTDREKNYTKPYNKHEVNPYTRTRIILMNGTEFEANWFCHQAARHTNNTDLRREMAAKRMQEKNQQLDISLLKPKKPSTLHFWKILTTCTATPICWKCVKECLPNSW